MLMRVDRFVSTYCQFVAIMVWFCGVLILGGMKESESRRISLRHVSTYVDLRRPQMSSWGLVGWDPHCRWWRCARSSYAEYLAD